MEKETSTYIFTSRRLKKRTLGELGKCSVVGFHTIPYFHNGVNPTTENFLFDDESLSNFTKEKPPIQKGKGRTRTRKQKSKNREHSIMVMHNKCCKRKHPGLAKGGKTYVLNFWLVAWTN
jgi:hypothetical protein